MRNWELRIENGASPFCIFNFQFSIFPVKHSGALHAALVRSKSRPESAITNTSYVVTQM